MKVFRFPILLSFIVLGFVACKEPSTSTNTTPTVKVPNPVPTPTPNPVPPIVKDVVPSKDYTVFYDFGARKIDFPQDTNVYSDVGAKVKIKTDSFVWSTIAEYFIGWSLTKNATYADFRYLPPSSFSPPDFVFSEKSKLQTLTNNIDGKAQVILYAVFLQSKDIVIYDINGGLGTVPTTNESYNENNSVVLVKSDHIPNSSIPGQRFLGWGLNKDAGYPEYLYISDTNSFVPNSFDFNTVSKMQTRDNNLDGRLRVILYAIYGN